MDSRTVVGSDRLLHRLGGQSLADLGRGVVGQYIGSPVRCQWGDHLRDRIDGYLLAWLEDLDAVVVGQGGFRWFRVWLQDPEQVYPLSGSLAPRLLVEQWDRVCGILQEGWRQWWDDSDRVRGLNLFDDHG